MRNPDYSAEALAKMVMLRSADVERLVYRLSRLRHLLADHDQHAEDHADETLAFIANALRATADRLDSLRAYTNYPAVEFQR